MTDDKGTNQTAAFLFVYVTVLLDALSLGIVFPVLPDLMTEFASAPAFSAPHVVGLFGTVWGLMQLLFSPVQSVLSDHFGRRPLLLISNISLGLGYILMASAPGFHWLLAGRAICGMSSASISTAFAYRSDVLPVERRTDGFGVLGVAMAAGTLFGPALGALLGSDDLRLPFWIAAGLSLANGIFGFLVLPESLARQQRAPFSWQRANPYGSLRFLVQRPEVRGLAMVNFLNNFSSLALPNIGALYMLYRYDWSGRMVGFAMAGIALSLMVVQGGLIGPAVKRFGERATLLIGLSCGAVAFAVFALAGSGAIFLAAIPLLAFRGFASPASLAFMSRRVPPAEQGLLQGAHSTLLGVSSLLAPAVLTHIFSVSTEGQLHFPGATFTLAALILTLALLIAWRTTRPGNQSC
jgi:DHA1 family tetracycline resistance protein-like MFS transporter